MFPPSPFSFFRSFSLAPGRFLISREMAARIQGEKDEVLDRGTLPGEVVPMLRYRFQARGRMTLFSCS